MSDEGTFDRDEEYAEDLREEIEALRRRVTALEVENEMLVGDLERARAQIRRMQRG